MDLSWLQVCAEGQTEGCIPTIQLLYLAALVAGVVLLGVIAIRSRDLSTATLALMPVAIAINIAVGAIVVALRLPIYLDSIGTVLVGVVAGPWAGALTGLLANLIWAILPVPGGAGPTIAFFAPVAAVIGLMAGFWAGRGAFRLRADDERVGGFLALAAGVAAAGIAHARRPADGRPLVRLGGPRLADALRPPGPRSSSRSAWPWPGSRAGRSSGSAPATRASRATWPSRPPSSAGVLVFAVLRLLFAPNGYFSTITGLTRGRRAGQLPGRGEPHRAGDRPIRSGLLAWSSPSRSSSASSSGAGRGRASAPACSRSGSAGLTTGLVAAAISAPIAAGVFGGVTGSGTDALVALFRTLGLNIFQSAFAQGLTSDPLDKTISYTVVFLVLAALPAERPDDVQPGRVDDRRLTGPRRTGLRVQAASGVLPPGRQLAPPAQPGHEAAGPRRG